MKADEVKASLKNRVSQIRLPKTEEAKTRTITVKIEEVGKTFHPTAHDIEEAYGRPMRC